jgi:hypothetical protein
MVEKFGREDQSEEINWDVFSEYIRELWMNGQKDLWINIVHCIQPNCDYDPKKTQSKYKKFMSCYYERGSMNASQGYSLPESYDTYLSEKGYDYFPVLVPRWSLTGEDVYGTDCPGMTALGDVKQLQFAERKIGQAVDKMVNPPMVGPTTLRGTKASILPADITYLDVREGQQGFRPAHEINFRIQDLEQKQSQVRQRISRAFFEDLFLMLANSDRRQITAREIDERHEEKLLALGPVLEQLNQDLLDPLIDITFKFLVEQGWIPEAPEELQGQDLKVEYISTMAQAQKMVDIGGLDRFSGFVANLAAQTQNPQLLDKLDSDQLIDVYADRTGVPPDVVRTDEEVAEIRAGRAQAQSAQMQSELMKNAAGTAKDLSQANLDGDNALSRLVQ